MVFSGVFTLIIMYGTYNNSLNFLMMYLFCNSIVIANHATSNKVFDQLKGKVGYDGIFPCLLYQRNTVVQIQFPSTHMTGYAGSRDYVGNL